MLLAAGFDFLALSALTFDDSPQRRPGSRWLVSQPPSPTS